MRLRDGFVIGDRYQVDGLLANGRRVRVYSAVSEPGGPGPVAVRVARHAPDADLNTILAGRRAVANEWQALRYLHDTTTSAVPLPIELVRMYPGDADVRRTVLEDRERIADEPYLVVQRVAGERLSAVVREGRLDEDRALALALRVTLLVGAAARVGLAFSGVDATDLVVDAAGENVVLVDVSRLGPDPNGLGRVGERTEVDLSRVRLPAGYGRMLVGLLSGASAPDWPADEGARDRWDELLATRRVPVELRSLALGALGYTDALDATVERVEDRLRALTRARRLKVFDHPPRDRDLTSPVRPGDVIAGRFEVRGELAQGARGFIVIAHDRRGDGEVLLKLNKYVYDSAGDFALELPTRRLELEHEFDVMRRFASTTTLLPQPVAKVHDDGRGPWFDLAPSRAPGEPVVAMRRLRGRPLLDLLARPLEGVHGASVRGNRLPPAFVMRVVTRVAGLLAVLHEQGFLFQDLKPENIVFDPASENVYLVDFASVCPRDASGLLRRDHVAFGVQTHGFAAPEFADLWERCDHRFDLYSLGATAYHLLTGVNPERVAIERGEEYPRLPFEPMRGLPEPVVDVVRRCLAPLEQRFTAAAEAARAADAARLWMSRSRPLDVRRPSLGFDDAGVRLRWTLPTDPRIDRIVVERTRGGETAIVYEGPPVDEVHDEGTWDPAHATSYLVMTSLRRGSDVLRSRGEVVRVEAHPAPVSFVVEPWFGANRLEVRVPPHADGVTVVARTDRPPTSPDDGEPIEVTPGDLVEHAAPASEPVFYAAFARYGADASAPRFGDAAPLAPLDDPGEVRVRQDEHGLTMSWDAPVAGARVVVDSESPGVAPGHGERFVVLRGLDRGAAMRVALRVERMGVVSEPLFEADVVRWPEPPAVEVREGPARVVLSVPADVPGALRHDALTPGGDVLATTESDVLVVPAAGDTELRLAVRTVVEPDGRGPETRMACVPPPADVAATFEVERDRLPVRLRFALPAAAARRTGDWRLQVTRDDGTQILTFVDPPGTATDASGIPVWRPEDPSATPGTTVRWQAHLTAPDGAVVCEREATCRVLEALDAPPVVPVLAGLEVAPNPDEATPDRVDIRVVRAHETRVIRDQSPPVLVALEPAESVQVAWRRVVDGPPMPWSPAVPSTTLQRPPTPCAGAASAEPDGVALSWTPADDEPTTWRVVTEGDERLVYEGEACRTIDVDPDPPDAWRVQAIRHGLTSEPLRIASREKGHRSRVTAAVPVASAQLASLDYEVRVRPARVRGRGWVEWGGDGRPALVAVVSGPTVDAARAAAVRVASLETGWAASDDVVGAMHVTTRRALIPARVPRGHAAVIATSPSTTGRQWREAAAFDAVPPGVLVGVAATHAERVRLIPVGGALDASTTRVRIERDDGSAREIGLTELEPLRISGAGRGAGALRVGYVLADAVALSLDGGEPAPIAVPLVAAEDPSAVWTRVFVDAARAALRHALVSTASRLGGVVARVDVSTTARVDALVAAEHTVLRARDVRWSSRGRLTAVWSVQRGRDGVAVRRSVDLTCPRDVFESLPDALVRAFARAAATAPRIEATTRR